MQNESFDNVNVAGALQTAGPIVSGGSVNARILIGTGTALGIYWGSGAPTVSAAQGSIYIRTDGSSATTRVYVNTNGATTWTSIATAA